MNWKMFDFIFIIFCDKKKICWIFFQPSSATIPPKTIEELIAKFKDIDVQNIDKSIGENDWANKFRSYLQKRTGEEDVNLLKFILKIEAFERNERKILANTKESKKAKLDQKILYKNIVMSHFDDENSDAIIGLSNSNVFEYLNEWAREPKNAISDLDVEILMKAKTDSSVISEGLDPSYKKFLAQTASSKLTACLLTIL